MCKFCVGTATKCYFNQSQLKVKAVSIPCGSWECEDCGKRKAILLGKRVQNGFKTEKARLLTLTYAGRKTLSSAIMGLKYSWNRLRGELVRKYGLTKFFWALEGGTKRGRPHLHVLINCYVPQKTLSRLCVKCGFGPIVDIRAVKDNGGFGYVFKYLEKGLGSYSVLTALKKTRGRRYGVSRNIAPVVNKNKQGVVLEFLKDEFTEEYQTAIVKTIAGVLCKKEFTFKKTKTSSEAEGKLSFTEEAAREILFAFNNGTLSKYDFLELGGWQFIPHGAEYVSAYKYRIDDADLDNLPF